MGDEEPRRPAHAYDDAHRVIAAAHAARERSEQLRTELQLVEHEAPAGRTGIGREAEAVLRALLEKPPPDEAPAVR